MTNNTKERIVELNKKQADFYQVSNDKRPFNPIMKIWRLLRRRMYYLMNNSSIWEDVFKYQKEWIGNLEGKKVLDFGCYDGNALSLYLAENSGVYYGVDLSSSAIERLRQNFNEKGIKGACLKSVDILSDEFGEKDFDIIYAQGVLHHFNPIDILLPVLNEKLVPGGKIVSLDPLQTSLLTKTVRKIYHPFRSDKEWEWPFRKEIFTAFKNYFHIVKLQGVIGRSKWAIPVAFFWPSMAVKIVQALHKQDLALATQENRHLWCCMQLVMCMEKPKTKQPPAKGRWV